MKLTLLFKHKKPISKYVLFVYFKIIKLFDGLIYFVHRDSIKVTIVNFFVIVVKVVFLLAFFVSSFLFFLFNRIVADIIDKLFPIFLFFYNLLLLPYQIIHNLNLFLNVLFVPVMHIKSQFSQMTILETTVIWIDNFCFLKE